MHNQPVATVATSPPRLMPGRYVSRVVTNAEDDSVIQLDVWFTGTSIDTVLMTYPCTDSGDGVFSRTHREDTKRVVLASKPVKRWRREQLLKRATEAANQLDSGALDDIVYDLLNA